MRYLSVTTLAAIAVGVALPAAAQRAPPPPTLEPVPEPRPPPAALGAVHVFEPIAAGIENTNYFLTTDKGRYVLTLYERLPAEELPFYLNLMAHLARAGVMAPAPEPDRTGALWSFLNGKPAGLVARLDGSAVEHPDVAHCSAVGHALAELHLAAREYRGRLNNRRGPGWWR